MSAVAAGKIYQVSKLIVDSAPLSRKAHIIRDDLAKKQRDKHHWQLLEQGEMLNSNGLSLWRIGGEAGFGEFAGLHGYAISVSGLPLLKRAENPRRAPMLGTRSIDSTGRSMMTPC